MPIHLYHPPLLKHRIQLRTPAPPQSTGRYGVAIDPPPEGTPVRAAVADNATYTEFLDGETVYVKRTTFTIRYRKDVAPNTQVLYRGHVYRAVGPAVVRGGPSEGLRSVYLEIVTELRQ